MKLTKRENQKIVNAIKWINGLSNTKFKQGTGELGDKESGFCCLGYACKRLNIPYDPREEFSELLVDRVGLNSEDGDIINGHKIYDDEKIFTPYTLAELNDDYGLSFRKISTILKKRAEDIFEPSVAKGIKKHFKKK